MRVGSHRFWVAADSEEVRNVSRWQRSLVALVVVSVVLAAWAALWGGAALWGAARADDAAVDAAPLILVGQKPRVQAHFPGNDAVFTIGITNTGTVTLQTVTVANATTPSCNRAGLGPLTPGQSTTYSCTSADVDDSFLNTVQATGVADGGATDSHIADAFVTVLSPDLRITKQQRTQTVRPGGTAHFTIVVFNTSPDTILTNIKVDDSAVDDCDFDPIVPVNLAPNDSFDYECQQTGIQSPLTSVATVRATELTSGDVLTTADAAWVEVLDMTADLTPQPTSVAEPGAPVTFQVNLVNSGSVPITLTALSTDAFGNILNANNPAVDAAHNTCLPQPALPTIQPYGGSFTCSFVAVVAGQPSAFPVTLTATAKDRNNLNETAMAIGTVTITNLPAEIDVSATADPRFIHPPGRDVTFNIRVDNTSAADTVTLTELRDEFLGSLDGRGTCNVPTDIPTGSSYVCAFTALVTGQTGQEKSRTITATAQDDDINPGTIADSTIVTVNITDLPEQYAYMPTTVDVSVVGSSCGNAFPLLLNRRYTFFSPPGAQDNPPPPNTQHVFRFELPSRGNVRVELTNFVPRAGQLVVWAGRCGELELLGRDPRTALNKTVNLGSQPAVDGLGARIQYIIQIINDGRSNRVDLYGLQVVFE